MAACSSVEAVGVAITSTDELSKLSDELPLSCSVLVALVGVVVAVCSSVVAGGVAMASSAIVPGMVAASVVATAAPGAVAATGAVMVTSSCTLAATVSGHGCGYILLRASGHG